METLKQHQIKNWREFNAGILDCVRGNIRPSAEQTEDYKKGYQRQLDRTVYSLDSVLFV